MGSNNSLRAVSARISFLRRVALTCAIALVTTVGVAMSAVPAAADSWPTDPSNPATPVTVSADGLPTVQINGVVWSQTVVGDIVYAGGNFSSARPPGAAAGVAEMARSNLVAYNINTGELTAFAPAVNGQVRSVAASPDGSRLYIGGTFTSVDGQTRNRIAAFDVATGQLVANFAPPVNYDVYSVVATNSTVFAGGDFQSVGTRDRGYLASFDAASGALLGLGTRRPLGARCGRSRSTPTGRSWRSAGQFTTLNGSGNPGYGLGMVDTTTGASLPMAVNAVVRNGGTGGRDHLAQQRRHNVYGGGYTFGTGGTLEGIFGASWDGGTVKFVNDCHGDTYSVHPQGNAVYAAGHAHFCGNVGGFPETSPRSFYRGLAFSKTATGTAMPDRYGYASFTGQPSSPPLAWYPSIAAGTFTGMNQGPWSVAGNDDYIVFAGEFTKVNNKPQQGLVRFAEEGAVAELAGPDDCSTPRTR